MITLAVWATVESSFSFLAANVIPPLNVGESDLGIDLILVPTFLALHVRKPPLARLSLLIVPLSA